MLKSIDSAIFHIAFIRQFAQGRQIRWLFGCPERLLYARIHTYLPLTKTLFLLVIVVLIVYHKGELSAEPLSPTLVFQLFWNAIRSAVLIAGPLLLLLQLHYFYKSHRFCKSPFDKMYLYGLMDSIRLHSRNLHVDIAVWILAAAVPSVLTLGWLLFERTTVICLALGTSLALVYLINFTIRLPTVLFLGSTDDNSLALQLKSEQIMYPLRVVSYIDPNNPGPSKYDVFLDNIRTNHGDNSWIDSVRAMMNVVPLIVLDARYPSDWVMEEAVWASQARWAFKAVFVVGDDGEAPILRGVWGEDKLPLDHNVQLVNESSLGELLLAIREGSRCLPAYDPDRDKWP